MGHGNHLRNHLLVMVAVFAAALVLGVPLGSALVFAMAAGCMVMMLLMMMMMGGGHGRHVDHRERDQRDEHAPL